jgi:DNA-binding transcriptional LysR family regulator
LKFDPDLKHLHVFLAVGKNLSYRRAAEELSISQPVLSRAIASMEDSLGFRVFERTTRVVRLTEAGKLLFDEVSKAFDQIGAGLRAAKLTASGHAGTIAVGYTTLATYGSMSEMLLQFNALEPRAQVELHLRSSYEQLSDLTSGVLDCGFLMSAACNDAFRHAKLYDERMVALVSHSHALSNRADVALSELKNEKFVFGRAKRWTSFRSVASAICFQAGFLPEVVEEADEVSILLRQISLGKGLTLYAASIREVLPPDIVALPVTDAHAQFGISLVWRHGDLPKLLQRFVKFMVSASEAREERLSG